MGGSWVTYSILYILDGTFLIKATLRFSNNIPCRGFGQSLLISKACLLQQVNDNTSSFFQQCSFRVNEGSRRTNMLQSGSDFRSCGLHYERKIWQQRPQSGCICMDLRIPALGPILVLILLGDVRALRQTLLFVSRYIRWAGILVVITHVPVMFFVHKPDLEILKKWDHCGLSQVYRNIIKCPHRDKTRLPCRVEVRRFCCRIHICRSDASLGWGRTCGRQQLLHAEISILFLLLG